MDKEDRYKAEADELVRLAFAALSEAEWRYRIADYNDGAIRCDAYCVVMRATWSALNFDDAGLSWMIKRVAADGLAT